MKNKKGLVLTTGVALFFLIIIIGVTLLVSFLVSGELRWILIGIAILIGFVYILNKAITTKFNITKTILLLLFLGVGLFFIIGSGFIQQAVILPNLFVLPNWGRLECAPTYDYEGIYAKMLDDTQIYKCNAFTEECRVTVKHIGITSLFTLRTFYRNCNLNNLDCGNWLQLIINPGDTQILPMLKSGRMYEFNTDCIMCLREKYGNVIMDWKPWKLYRFVGAAKWIVNSYNCDITSGAKPQIRATDYPSVGQLYRGGGEGIGWINYLNDWVYGPGTNVFKTYPGYEEVYCTAGQVFRIVKIQMSDGALVKLDPSYSGTLSNGEYLSGLGTRIAYVECCPNEPNCGDDFKYLPEPEPEKECISDLQCYNAGGPVPVDSTHYVIWQCINDKCIESAPIEVECTTSAHCPAGQICDLSTMNYGKCIEQYPSYCGDGVCDITESFSTCPADCGQVIECKWFENYYEKEHCGFTCKLGITKPTIESGCKTSAWVYVLIAGLIVAISITTFIIVKTKKKKKKRRH